MKIGSKVTQIIPLDLFFLLALICDGVTSL